VEAIISAAVYLHNFIMKKEEYIGFQSYYPPGYVDYYNENGSVVPNFWQNENTLECMTQLNRVESNHAATIAMKQQDTIVAYPISNQGQIFWQ